MARRNATMRLLELAGVMQRGAEIGPGIGVVRVQLDRAAIGRDRLVEALKRMQRIAEIAVRLGETRIGGDRRRCALAASS